MNILFPNTAIETDLFSHFIFKIVSLYLIQLFLQVTIIPKLQFNEI